jgi:hypothetical protein
MLGGAIWKPVGTGDFNADGTPDIFWWASGMNRVWFLDGTAALAEVLPNPPFVSDPNWHAVAIHDYNGDRKPDIVWRHALSGQNVLWFMNGTTLASGIFIDPSLPDMSWKIVGPR